MASGSMALQALLGVILWALFIFWVVEWFVYPTDRYTSWKADAIARTNTSFLGYNGEDSDRHPRKKIIQFEQG